ncbi:restriction endonuclease [Streptomyces sp. ventii]|uniref:Restriction endonuclease n=1 Tax=Streptomyces spiramenti TaxID=2720606 RepID=A0ABX1AI77_9ACTN|nr:restriction endonuclease [Streptomyces spiramenti]
MRRGRAVGGRRRAQRPSFEAAAPVLLGVAALAAFTDRLLAVWWVAVLTALLALGAGADRPGSLRRRFRRGPASGRSADEALAGLDALHHSCFEDAVRDMMRRDGCRDAARVGGAGDLGADVTATDPFGRRWVIQCKHRRQGAAGSPVGTQDFQVLNGTARQVHGADIAVIVTNGRVTAPAVTFAGRQRLQVVDRPVLGAWASGSHPLWELLRTVPPPRSPG